MTLSDVLVVVSILIAIASISLANNKRLILYKFSWFGILLSVFVLSVVTCLIVVPNFYESIRFPRWIPQIDYSLLAFFITIIYLISILLYILKCNHFPAGNNDKIIEYYSGLVETNMPLLIEFINSYHRKGIENTIGITNVLAAEEEKKDILQIMVDENNYEKQSKKRKHRNENADLDMRVLHKIVMTKPFIINSMNIDSACFLKIVSSLKTDRVLNLSEMVMFYFQTLLNIHSDDFKSELYEFATNDNKTIVEQTKYTKYLKYLFQNGVNWVRLFNVDQTIGEFGLQELAEGQSIWDMHPDEWKNRFYKNSVARVFLQFYYVYFKYMVEFREEHHILERCGKLFNNYLIYYTQEFAKRFDCNGDTYAAKFFEDIQEHYEHLYNYLYKKNTVDLIDILMADQCEMSKSTDCTCLIEDGLKNIIDSYLSFYDKDSIHPIVKAMEQFLSKKNEVQCKYKAIRKSKLVDYWDSKQLQHLDELFN